MALDIFFLEDIRNAILAANEASSATAAEAAAVSQNDNGWCTHVPIITEPEKYRFRCDMCDREWRFDDVKEMLRRQGGNHYALRDYRRGYRAALSTLALAFGLSPAIIEGEDLAELPPPMKKEEYCER